MLSQCLGGFSPGTLASSSSADTQVFWSEWPTPEDLLSRCGGLSRILWCGLLGVATSLPGIGRD